MATKATKKTTTKKPLKKSTKKTVPSLASLPSELPVLTPPSVSAPGSRGLSPRLLTLSLIVLGIALLTYKAGPYFVPALVGSTPVTRFEIWSRLEKTYGTQTLDDLVNEKILDRAITQSGVKVDQARVDEQIKSLESQFESLGGLDAALEQRGMNRDELIKQVKTQLSVEEILKDKVNPSDEEIKQAFDAGSATTYKDKKFEAVQEQIKEELIQTKLVEAFRDWFATIKADAKLRSFGL